MRTPSRKVILSSAALLMASSLTAAFALNGAHAQEESEPFVYVNTEAAAQYSASGIAEIDLQGDFQQGGLVFGQAPVGAKIYLDGEQIDVSNDGSFVIGFDRDQAKTAMIAAEFVGGVSEETILQVKSRIWEVENIDLPPNQSVTNFTKAQLEHIGRSTAKKKKARSTWTSEDHWKSGFGWPIDYWDIAKGRLSSTFGYQRFYNGVPKRYHSGMDIASPKGTPIKAPADGLIMLADSDMFFEGGLILMDHGLKLESAFMHMSKVSVKAGDVVKKGDIIGEVGSTGRSTGPHLHWGLKWRSHKIDPKPLLPAEGTSGQASSEGVSAE